MGPIMYPFEKPALMGRMAIWLLLFAEFDLKFIICKPVKEEWCQNPCRISQYKEWKDQEFEIKIQKKSANPTLMKPQTRTDMVQEFL